MTENSTDEMLFDALAPDLLRQYIDFREPLAKRTS